MWPYLALIGALVLGAALVREYLPLPGPPPHTGEPRALSPEDGPFTTEQLIELAHYYHPRLEHMAFKDSDEYSRLKAATPQRKALDIAHKRLMANRAPWKDLVATLEEALPGYRVIDGTRSYIRGAAFLVGVTAREDDGYFEEDRRVVGIVSGVAPIFFIYEAIDFRTLRYPISDRSMPMAAMIEREIRARFPYHRIEHETAMTIVPDIECGNSWYGETSVLDALFSPVWR